MFRKIVHNSNDWALEGNTRLPTILSSYGLKDIFNADEFGFFFHSLPIKTLELKREKSGAGKDSKVRLTGMCTASATDEKLPLIVIGKSKNARCFKRTLSPCHVSQSTTKTLDRYRDLHRLRKTPADRKSLVQNR